MTEQAVDLHQVVSIDKNTIAFHFSRGDFLQKHIFS